MVMHFDEKEMVVWEPAVMITSPEYVYPWSTWVKIRRIEEEKEPHNMMLLMQHAYARCPIPRCSEIIEMPFPTEEEPPSTRQIELQRRYIPRNYVSKQKKQVKPRFILPRFKNIPARIDSNLRLPNEIKMK